MSNLVECTILYRGAKINFRLNPSEVCIVEFIADLFEEYDMEWAFLKEVKHVPISIN